MGEVFFVVALHPGGLAIIRMSDSCSLDERLSLYERGTGRFQSELSGSLPKTFKGCPNGIIEEGPRNADGRGLQIVG